MSNHHLRSHLSRRYVRLILEELECRYVPSLLGLQLELPLSGILPSLALSAGPGATPAPAATTTPSTITTSPSVVSISWSSSPSGQSSNPTSITVIFVSSSALQQSAPTSSASNTDASSAGTSSPGTSSAGTSTTNASSASSSTAFNQGASQASGNTFTFPTIAIPALGIQSALAGSSNVLGGSVSGINFEFLGNMPELLGPSNVLQGTLSSALSAGQPIGAPYGGSVFGPLNLFMDRMTGATAAFGLMHPAPEQQPEEPLPENPPAPPTGDWWISVPQTSEQDLPPGAVPLLKEMNLPPSDMWLSPAPVLPVNNQALDARSNGIPQDFLFSEDDVGIPADEDQSEEQSGISAAMAILSCAVGAYWAPRFRSSRRVAAALPVIDQDA